MILNNLIFIDFKILKISFHYKIRNFQTSTQINFQLIINFEKKNNKTIYIPLHLYTKTALG